MTAGKWPLPLLELSEYSQAEGERRHQKEKPPDMKSEHTENQEYGHWGKSTLLLSENILGNGEKSHSCTVDSTKKKQQRSWMLSIYHLFQVNKFCGRPRGSCTADNHKDLSMTQNDVTWLFPPETSDVSSDF